MGETISAKDTARVIRKAMNIAMSGCPGPVHLGLPSDISIQKERVLSFYKENIVVEKSIPSSDVQKKIVQINNLIEESKFPLIIVGIRANHDNISQLILNLSEEECISVMVTPKIKGKIPEDYPLFLGVIGGMVGDKVILELLEK
jgi:acetolactate synthase-1/2/3 large subunit